MKNSGISTMEYYEYMNNTNKIIYVIGHPIGFVRIEIKTCIPKIVFLFLLYTLIPAHKFSAKYYLTTMEFTRYKKYSIPGVESLQRP